MGGHTTQFPAPPGSGRVGSGFVLSGGPMDGWYVTSDAPALRADWWMHMPMKMKIRYAPRPGRYVRIGRTELGVERAEWREEV